MPAAAAAAAPPPAARAPERLHYLDYLRAGVVALVFVHHTAITYGASGSWYYSDASRSKVVEGLLTLLAAYDQAWFMGFLFFVSGYFSLPSLARKGPGAYVADRLRRFGIPLLVYMFVISPVVTWLALLGGPAAHPRLIAYWWSRYLSLRTWDTGPLWFVWALLLMDLLLAAWATRRDHRDLAVRRPTPFPGPGRLVAFAAAVGVAAFLVRLAIPVGDTVLFGLQLGYFPGYVAMFLAGIAAWRRGWLDAIPDAAHRFARRSAAVGAVLLPIILVVGARSGADAVLAFAGGLHWQAAAYALWEPWVLVGMTIVLLRWGQRRFNRASARWQAWAAASYPAYILQPLAIVGFAVLIRYAAWPALAKFGVVSAASIVALYAAARVVRGVPWIRRVIG